MSINRKFFLNQVNLVLFDGEIRKSQAESLLRFLDYWENRYGNCDDRWLAYILATAHHETGRVFQPIRETFAQSDAQVVYRLEKSFGAGRLTWVKAPYWRPDADGKSWFGRGFVQITHRENYLIVGRLIGEDLASDPSKALDFDVALKVIFEGMISGVFTGRKLADFFWEDKAAWRDARRIINGIESADLVGSYARRYYSTLSYTT